MSTKLPDATKTPFPTSDDLSEDKSFLTFDSRHLKSFGFHEPICKASWNSAAFLTRSSQLLCDCSASPLVYRNDHVDS